MGNIFNHNRPIFMLRTSKSDYWDTHLYESQSGSSYSGLQEDCLSAYIDTTDTMCIEENGLVSKNTVDEETGELKYMWSDAVNNGITLNNIGLTGVDNGLLAYDKDSITDDEFKEIFTNSKLEIDEGDFRLHVNNVNGNNEIYSYDTEFVCEDNMRVSKLKGGFYQGFYKTGNGCNYNILPTELGDGICMEFVLKPRKIKSEYRQKMEEYNCFCYNNEYFKSVLNKTIVSNIDELLSVDKSNVKQLDLFYVTDIDSNVYDTHLFILLDEENPNNIDSWANIPLPTLNDIYPENAGTFFYMGTRAENKWWRYYTDTEDNTDIETYDGYSVSNKTDNIIRTNNKFITYNRTKNGYRAKMGNIDDLIKVDIKSSAEDENYFILMNRGKSGYTARTIERHEQEVNADYDILGDLYNNAFALQIKEDGSIGYKYMVKDCTTDTGYSINNEWSYPNLVPYDEWSVIDVRIVPCIKYGVECDGYIRSKDYMRIMIYVNGRLVLYSKMLEMFNFRMLNDIYSKQEGVPFNISLGGGTQGLCDVIYENYKELPEYILFLEREYGGSFNGYFKSFKFYSCDQKFTNILANVEYEIQIIKNYINKTNG